MYRGYNETNSPNYNIQLILLVVATIITVFAALPVLMNSDIYKMILLFVWIINFFCNIMLFKTSFTTISITVLLSWVLYIVYCAIMYIINGDGYLNGTYFYSVNLSIFIFINGCFLSHERTKDVFNAVTKVYNFCSIIVILYIYFTNFWNTQFFEAQSYIYRGKNSIGPIIVCNLVIFMMQEKRSNTIAKVARYICQGFLIYLLLLVNNRAGVIELIAVIICYIFFVEKSYRSSGDFQRNRLALILIPILCCAVLITIIPYWNVAVEKIVSFFKWALKLELINDLDKFSSGRISLYYLTINYAIKVSPLFGVGMWYTDLFYISLLAELGLIGSIPIFIILLTISIAAVKNIKNRNNNLKLLGLLAVQILTATFFEGLPPFGPGTVVFIFWLLFGAYEGSKPAQEKAISS